MNKFTVTDIENANAQLKMLAFYPSDAETQAAIMKLLAKMCPHREALEWLVEQMVTHIGSWHGPAELRGVLCWHYRPADGLEANCTLAGFRPADGECKSIEEHEERHRLENGASRTAVKGWLN